MAMFNVKALVSFVLLAFIACPPLLVSFVPDAHLSIKMREYFDMSSALFGNGHHYSTSDPVTASSDGTPLLDLDGVDEDSDRAVMMQRKVRVELQAQDRRYTEVVYADNLNANGNSTNNASTIAPRPAPSTSFLAPTAAPPTGAIAWTVASGTCTINPTSNCAMSPNYPAQYGNNERCEITVTNPGPVNKEAFQTERGWDKLNVNGINYDGNDAGFADRGEEVRSMSWRSDGSVTSNGWKFCPSGGSAPTLPPNDATTTTTQPPSGECGSCTSCLMNDGHCLTLGTPGPVACHAYCGQGDILGTRAWCGSPEPAYCPTQAPTQPPSCPADTCSPTDYTSCWNSRCASCAHCLAPTTQPPTQQPTQPPNTTQAPTQPPTQAPTQPEPEPEPTQPPTQAPTQTATQPQPEPEPTQAPTQAPTQPPADTVEVSRHGLAELLRSLSHNDDFLENVMQHLRSDGSLSLLDTDAMKLRVVKYLQNTGASSEEHEKETKIVAWAVAKAYSSRAK